MKYFFQLIVFIFFMLNQGISHADSPYYLNFKYILNESTAGKKAQTFLKNKLDKGVKNLRTEKTKILEEEKINTTKKILDQDEYKKKLQNLEIKYLKYKKKDRSFKHSSKSEK